MCVGRGALFMIAVTAGSVESQSYVVNGKDGFHIGATMPGWAADTHSAIRINEGSWFMQLIMH